MAEAFYVRRAAVLGAGVMGAQIAAHLANAGVEVLLFELPAEGSQPNANVLKAITRLRKLEPSPLAEPAVADRIQPANYEQHLPLLGGCELIIEAIAERLDWKRDLYRKIAPHVAEGAVLASNTSGLSIAKLAEVLPEPLRPRFCGVHFFNPPRYMQLVELIGGEATEPRVLEDLESFLTTTVGKGVVRAKDTPNFIANRVGVFSLLATMHHGARLELPFDVVDALTGPAIGRPKSATYRTADVVGLDTLAHVVDGTAPLLTDDPWHKHLTLPEWMRRLIAEGALGQKSGAGVYRKRGKEIQVLDSGLGDYRPARGEIAAEVQQLLAIRDPGERLAALRGSEHPQARFLWAIHRDVFHYAACHLESIADSTRDLDFAIRWGFGWKQGPFELWQAAGWRRVAEWVAADIAEGMALSDAPLPDWVGRIEAAHTAAGSWSPALGDYRPRSSLPVYRRQLFPEPLLGEAPPATGETLLENDAVRLWSLDGEIAILSFKSKANSIGFDVLDGVHAALDIAERDCRALVIWQTREPFSVGANLQQVVDGLGRGEFDYLERMVARFQETTARLRYARIPVVGAVRGMALGGGCEFLMHCDRVVAALESYIGLVEVGVGVIPAGGGCKEFAHRAAAQAPDGNLLPYIKNAFETIAMAKVSRSALDAKRLGLLRPEDLVVLNPHELLYVALVQARALADSGYRPPVPAPIPVAGRNASAVLRTVAVNMREGGFISEHDERLAAAVADALTGGELDAGTSVDASWLLEVERRHFMAMLREPKTRDRIVHMLETGKPLRN